METKHLSYFKVENFKRFDSLEVNDIGQFNLVVGDNNVGKTSLLEALLFDEDDYNNLIEGLLYILSSRTIEIDNMQQNYLDFFLKDKLQPLSYQFNYNNTELHKLQLIKRNRSSLKGAEANGILLQLQLNTSAHLIQFNQDNNPPELRLLTTLEKDYFDYFPLVTFRCNDSSDIADFFSEVSISNKKLEELKADLKYFIPDLISIELNNFLVPDKTLVAIRESNSEYAQPLAQYGDGTMKFFGNLLEINLSENERLMIDEIDAGIHYSKMKGYLKRVLHNAKNKNVQIFATTHSKECLEYYKEALQELGYENDSRVIKLADTKSGIKSYTYNFEQFENALLAESEIR